MLLVLLSFCYCLTLRRYSTCWIELGCFGCSAACEGVRARTLSGGICLGLMGLGCGVLLLCLMSTVGLLVSFLSLVLNGILGSSYACSGSMITMAAPIPDHHDGEDLTDCYTPAHQFYHPPYYYPSYNNSSHPYYHHPSHPYHRHYYYYCYSYYSYYYCSYYCYSLLFLVPFSVPIV